MRVDIVIPVRNAATQLSGCVGAIRAQTHLPGTVYLAVGPSTDRTATVAEALAASVPNVVVVPNSAGDRASGLNAALALIGPQTDAVAMVDAQSRLAGDYLERAVAALEGTNAAVVGGPMRPAGDGVVGQAIAAALRSPVGVGNSSFHFVGAARDVDSVYLGIYRRDVLEAVGPYDPALLRTEDDDMNARIRVRGGRIRLDPSIRSTYLARRSLSELYRQYHGYGYWKVALATVRPDAIRPRHFVPAAFVFALAGSAVASVVLWRPTLPLFLAAYAVAGFSAAVAADGLPIRSRVVLPFAIGAMHVGYGLGTWQAIARLGRTRRKIAAHCPGDAP